MPGITGNPETQSVSCVMAKTKIADKTSLRRSLCLVHGSDKTGISKEPGLMIKKLSY